MQQTKTGVENARMQIVTTEKLAEIASNAMEAYYGLERARSNAASAEEYFGFAAHDVSDIHLRKHGTGRGVWFRLRDGRVYDCAARPSETDRMWYEGALH